MLKQVFIGANVNYTSASNPNALANGEIGVFSIASDGTFTLLNTTPNATQLARPIMIAQRSATGGVISHVIQPRKKVGYVTQDFAAANPNIFVTGFDGTSFDLLNGAAGQYQFKVQNLTEGNFPFPTYSSTPFFAVASQATSAAIAQAIVKDVNSQAIIASTLVMPSQFFAFSEMLSDSSSVQLVTSAPANVTGTVINGSNVVTLSASTAGGTTVVAPGTWLRIGHATTKTAAVYKVAAVQSNTTVFLETPYVNANVALGTSISSVALGFATNANIVAAAAGIRTTALGSVFLGSDVQERQANKMINVSLDNNLGYTPIQTNNVVGLAMTAANGAVSSPVVYTEGRGLGFQILKKELEAAGYKGFGNRIFYKEQFPVLTNPSSNYDSILLEVQGDVTDHTAQGFVLGEVYQIIISTITTAGQMTNLRTVLSAY
jgi:hypothetical protein